MITEIVEYRTKRSAICTSPWCWYIGSSTFPSTNLRGKEKREEKERRNRERKKERKIDKKDDVAI